VGRPRAEGPISEEIRRSNGRVCIRETRGLAKREKFPGNPMAQNTQALPNDSSDSHLMVGGSASQMILFRVGPLAPFSRCHSATCGVGWGEMPSQVASKYTVLAAAGLALNAWRLEEGIWPCWNTQREEFSGEI
jgi:hypothetical protein